MKIEIGSQKWKKEGKKYCARCSAEFDSHWYKCQRCGMDGEVKRKDK